MFKKIIVFLITLAFAAPLYTQEKNKTEKKEEKKAEESKTEKSERLSDETKKPAPAKKVTVWQQITLEDFETAPYSNKNLSFNVTSDQEAKLTIRDQLPGNANSKKYLGLKFKTKGGDTFTIKPAKDIIIDKYCKSISFWVYGKKSGGELSFMLQDTKEVNHHIIITPTINFSGWKQITVPIGTRVAQEDDYMNQKKTMKILSIQYRTATGSMRRLSSWEFLYLDDITATVRERYDDKQSDEW